MKQWKKIVSLLLALLLFTACAASAEYYDGYSYEVYYVTYNAGAVSGWNVMRYAETEGVLLDMYTDTASVSVTLTPIAQVPTLDALAKQHLSEFEGGYISRTEAVSGDWYAPWRENEAGRKLEFTYSYTAAEGSETYHVADYLAALNDEYYVMVELTDWSDRAGSTAAQLESGFLNSFGVDSFMVNGNSSACLTAAEGQTGSLKVTLQPYGVQMSEDGTGYVMVPNGEAVTVPVADNACILAPGADDIGFLYELALNGDTISRFIRDYRAKYGQDCVFSVLMYNGKVVWMTFSYLMM